MATREQLAEYRKKAVKSPLIGKHGKRKATIEKEKRRAIFDEIVSQEFPQIIADARPEYKLDQFLGKADDNINIKGVLKLSGEEQIAQLAKETAARMKGYDTDTTTTSGT